MKATVIPACLPYAIYTCLYSVLQRSRFYTVLRCRWGFGLKDTIEPLPLSHEELGCPLVIFHGHLPGREEAADGGEPVLGALLQLEIGVDVVRLRPDIVRRTGILIFFESQGIEIILMMVWNIVIHCLRQSVLSPSATAKLQKVAASLSGGERRPPTALSDPPSTCPWSRIG